MLPTANPQQPLNHFEDIINSPRSDAALREFLDQLHALSHRITRRLDSGTVTAEEFNAGRRIVAGLKVAIDVVQQTRLAATAGGKRQ